MMMMSFSKNYKFKPSHVTGWISDWLTVAEWGLMGKYQSMNNLTVSTPGESGK